MQIAWNLYPFRFFKRRNWGRTPVALKDFSFQYNEGTPLNLENANSVVGVSLFVCGDFCTAQYYAKVGVGKPYSHRFKNMSIMKCYLGWNVSKGFPF